MRVLVAEQGARLREAAADALRAAGHEVLTCEDGLSAWHELSKGQIDAVFADAGLNPLDGLLLHRLVQDCGFGGRFVLMAEPGAMPWIRTWRGLTGEGGALEVLGKPFPPGLLTEVLHTPPGA